LEEVQELHIKLEEEKASSKVSLALGSWNFRKERVRQEGKNYEYAKFHKAFTKSKLYIKRIPIYREEGVEVACSTTSLNHSLHNKLGLRCE